MILKVNKSSLKLPAIGLIHRMSFRHNDFKNNYERLKLVTIEDIQNLRKRTPTLKGAPYCYALIHTSVIDSTLEIYPIADKDYEFEIIYFPPLQKI